MFKKKKADFYAHPAMIAARNGDTDGFDLEMAKATGKPAFKELSEEILKESAAYGHASICEKVLPFVPDKETRTEALMGAIRNSSSDCVRILAKNVRKSTKTHDLIYVASNLGQYELIEVLLPLAGDNFKNFVMSDAAIAGNLKVVEMMAKHADHESRLNACLGAARTGKLPILKVLLPDGDDRQIATSAFVSAANSGQVECARFLFPKANLSEVRKMILNDGSDGWNIFRLFGKTCGIFVAENA